MRIKTKEMIWGDLLAGAGGVTTGALAVKGILVAWALNHSKEAIFTHQVNHPNTEHFHANLNEMDVTKLCRVDGLFAGLECTNFSNAKGGLSRDADSRMLAYELTRYILHCRPKYIMIENVREFLDWGPLRIKEDKAKSTKKYSVLAVDKKGKYVFIPIKERKKEYYNKWIEHVKGLGYINYEYRMLNSADYGSFTSRRRYFGIFSLPGHPISFPQQTHHKDGINGFKKWRACKSKIDLKSTGESMFGRKFNTNLAKHVRKPLVKRSINRIINGMKKHCPDMLQYIIKYYGEGGGQNSAINTPLDTITTKDRHALVTLEKEQFISEHFWGVDPSQKINQPLNVITCKESKQLVTIEKQQFINQCWGNDYNHTNIKEPLKTITTTNKHQLVTVEKQQFLGQYYGRDNAHQNIKEPLRTITTWNSHRLITVEKQQFISTYFENSKTHSLKKLLGTITTQPKHALTTVMTNEDFDIKVRFLTPEELGGITGFPKNYAWYGSKRLQVWMIGNAVPIPMAKALIEQTKIEFTNLTHIKS